MYENHVARKMSLSGMFLAGILRGIDKKLQYRHCLQWIPASAIDPSLLYYSPSMGLYAGMTIPQNIGIFLLPDFHAQPFKSIQ